MRAIVEYRKHAEGCRRLAMQATSDDKRILENLARSWEMLAQIRKHDLEPEPDAARATNAQP
jgi:hypothetical protein